MKRWVPVAGVLVLAACREQPYRHYATAAEAVAAGERDGGRLPAWLPPTAEDVYLQADPENNRWWLRAKLSRTAADSLRAVLSPIAAESVAVVHPRGGSSWWFQGLIEQQPANDGALYSEPFRGTGAPVPRATIIVFDRGSPGIYAWTTLGQ
jgi:hypothetical protein